MKTLLGILMAIIIGQPCLWADSLEVEVKNRYIALFHDSVENPTTAAHQIARGHGLEVLHVYKNSKGFAFRSAQRRVIKDPRIRAVVQDKIVRTFAQQLPTGIDRADVDKNPLAAIDGIDTRVDVDIAIIDTGIDIDHPDLNVYRQVNFSSGRPSAKDGNGHGTHVAGTAAAIDNTIGVIGGAPGARLWAIKVLKDNGSGFLSDVIKGIDYVTSHASEIDVANMSLGGSGSADNPNDPFHEAIRASVAAGVVYTVAAGNAGADAKNTVPAAYAEVITVSAIVDTDGQGGALGPDSSNGYGSDDTFASFSNYGEAIDIAAPGVEILSTYKDGGYATLNGTSMASPHVAGIAALHIAQFGKPANAAEVEAVKQALISSGKAQSDPDYGFSGDKDTFAEPLVYAGEEIHDLALTSIVAPSVALEGDIVTVDVSVSNTGDFAESSTLELKDLTTGEVIGTVSFSLATGETKTYSFSWDTLSKGLGEHELEARAAPVTNEKNTTNNVKTTVVNVKEPSHDVAVLSIDVLSTVLLGDVVSVSVTVENQGTYMETSSVTVEDTTDGVTIGSQSVSLEAGEKKTLSFDWDTSLSTLGSHALEGSIDSVSGEVDLTDNTLTTTVQVDEKTGNRLDMYVKSIDFRVKRYGPGKRFRDLMVDVTIFQDSNASGTVDSDDVAAGQARVDLTLSVDVDGDGVSDQSFLFGGDTNSSGVITFTLKQTSAGNYEAIVDLVRHASLTYNTQLNVETSDTFDLE